MLLRWQTRVAVMWDRLIRPDGIDIEIASAGVDQLGRTGVAGTVYDHFWRKIGNAFLVSYVVPVAAAEAAKKATNIKTSDNTETKNKDGSTTTTTNGDPVAQAITDSTKQFSDISIDNRDHPAKSFSEFGDTIMAIHGPLACLTYFQINALKC